MVVGNECTDTKFPGRGHPLQAGYTVIHGNNQVGFIDGRECNNLWGEAIAILKAIGHQVVDMTGAKGCEDRDRKCSASSAICIKVANNNNPIVTGKCICQHRRRAVRIKQQHWGLQALKR